MSRARSRARALVAASMAALSTFAPSARGEAPAERPHSNQAPWGADFAGADEAEAERLFELGKQAVATGRFADARQHFEASLARMPRVAAAFNLAIAYRGLGMPMETLEMLARVERGVYGALREERHEQVRRLSDEARRDIAHLDVHVTGAAVASIRINGRDVGNVEGDALLVVPTNPGEHAVHVSGEGVRPVDEQVSLEPGERRVVTFRLTPLPRMDRAPVAERRASIFQSVWFWGVAAVAVTVATTATVYVLSSSEGAPPVSDPSFGVIPTSLSWR